MISSINPIGPSIPPGNSPDVTAIAKAFGTELDTAIAELSNLDLKNLDPKIGKIAQLLTDLSTQAHQALTAAGK